MSMLCEWQVGFATGAALAERRRVLRPRLSAIPPRNHVVNLRFHTRQGWLEHPPPLPGRGQYMTSPSTGSAAAGFAAPPLHPWLQAVAPLGRSGGSITCSFACTHTATHSNRSDFTGSMNAARTAGMSAPRTAKHVPATITSVTRRGSTLLGISKK